MKTLVISVIIGAAITLQNAEADTYKCIKNGHPIYQSTPCDTQNPDANKVDIKEPTAQEKAQAQERLQQIKADYEARKQSKPDQNAKPNAAPANAATFPAAPINVVPQNDQTVTEE